MNGTNRYKQETDVEHYEKSRYETKDQKLISRMEQELIVETLRGLKAPRGKVLDVPCGYGRFTGHLLDLGWTPTVADVSPAMVAHTQKVMKQRYGVDLLGGEANLFGKLNYEPGVFDGAICIRMFHNTLESANRVAVFKALSAVVSDWIVITYYNDAPLHRAQFAIRRKTSRNARQTMSFVSHEQLAAEAAQAGLRIESDRAVLPLLHAQRVAVLRKT